MPEQEKNIEQLATELKKATDSVKDLGEELKGKMANGEKGLEDLKERVDEALTTITDTKTRLDDIEQKMARRGHAQEAEKSIAQQLMDTEGFKLFAQDPRSGKSAKLSLKATITSLTTDAAGSAGALVVEHPTVMRLPMFVKKVLRIMLLRKRPRALKKHNPIFNLKKLLPALKL